MRIAHVYCAKFALEHRVVTNVEFFYDGGCQRAEGRRHTLTYASRLGHQSESLLLTFCTLLASYLVVF